MTEAEYYLELQKNEENASYENLFTTFSSNTTTGFEYNFTQLDYYKVLKERYCLDNISGVGTTLEKSLNIMKWLTEKTFYCGYSNFTGKGSLAILEYSIDKGFCNAINCEQKANLLSDLLLSINIAAVPIVLVNHKQKDGEYSETICHVVIQVYLTESEKWIMLDPSFNAFFMCLETALTEENDSRFTRFVIDDSNNILNIIDIKNKNIKSRLGQYSLNGHNEILQKEYINKFIKEASFGIYVSSSNIAEHCPMENLLLPINTDAYKYLYFDQLARGINKNDIKISTEQIKLISVNELLSKPNFI